MKRLTATTLLALATAAAALPPLVHAQAWPTKPVKWILSQPAGSGPDVISRYVAEHLSKAIGQPIVIENRPGGQNVIGAQAAAKSAPDGYTFYYGTTAAIVTLFHGARNIHCDLASADVATIQFRDGSLGFCVIGHFNKSEPARATGFSVVHQTGAGNLPALGKHFV